MNERVEWRDTVAKAFTAFVGIYDIFRKRGAPCIMSNSTAHLRLILGVDLIESLFHLLMIVLNNDIVFLETRDQYLKKIKNSLNFESDLSKLPEDAVLITLLQPGEEQASVIDSLPDDTDKAIHTKKKQRRKGLPKARSFNREVCTPYIVCYVTSYLQTSLHILILRPFLKRLLSE